MNPNQQSEALRIARLVRSGELSKANGARLLSENANIPPGSAGIIIAVYLNMGKGMVLKRTLSTSDMVFFLDAIAEDEGTNELRKALKSLRLHIEYRESDGANPIQNREILARFQDRLRDMESDTLTTPIFLSDLEQNFNSQIAKAQASTQQERDERLARAKKLPKKIAKLVYVFERNADVVVEVLRKAGGTCGQCGNRAPFKRKSNGTPYLEVHHKVPLAENGEDTVENAIALCPNCHRERHYGA